MTVRRPKPLVLLLLAVAVASAAPAAREAGADIEATVRSRYPQILSAWARGDAAGALEQLDALETSLVRARRGPEDIEDLWRAKLGVIRDTISRSSIEVLVPIMLLHHDAYRHYAAKGGGLFSNHAQRMSAELADFYAKNSSREAAATVSADLLASLAGHLQSGMMMRRSAQLFSEALDLDPTNTAAHMGLGALFERRGQLADAARHYQRATVLAPDHGEALLRHAVCAARLGEAAVARRQLARVLTLDAPDWVHQVAYQEAIHVADDADERLRLAREARERFPESSRQAIQLAFVLEQRRESRRALEALAEMAPSAEGDSARYRYAHWPGEVLAEIRARLAAAARAESEVLSRAAGSVETTVPGE